MIIYIVVLLGIKIIKITHFNSYLFELFHFVRYTCDVADGRCNKGDVSLPFYKKIESIAVKKEKEVSLSSVVCPDGSSFCPRDYTCCKMADGAYGCCPLDNAVCCSGIYFLHF